MLTLATTNAGKIREIKELLQHLALPIKSLSDFPEIGTMPIETGLTFKENALIKARYVWKKLTLPPSPLPSREGAGGGAKYYVLADDSGLECEDLQGAPGVFSARFAGPGASDEENNQKLISLFADLHDPSRRARYVCALALIDPKGKEILIEESCEGIITLVASGSGGFGYDPYFYLPEYKATMAEIPLSQKNKISHRGKALEKLLGTLSASR